MAVVVPLRDRPGAEHCRFQRMAPGAGDGRPDPPDECQQKRAKVHGRTMLYAAMMVRPIAFRQSAPEGSATFLHFTALT